MDRIVGSALSVALESIAHVQFESTRIDQPLLAVTANVLARPVNKIGNVVNPDCDPGRLDALGHRHREESAATSDVERTCTGLEFGTAPPALLRAYGGDMVIPISWASSPHLGSLAVVLPVDLLHDGADAIGLDDTRGHERIDRRRPAGGTAPAEHSVRCVDDDRSLRDGVHRDDTMSSPHHLSVWLHVGGTCIDTAVP